MCSKQTQTVLLTAWLATALAAAAATGAPDRWALDIARTRQGEWWRLISGHLVHLNWQHYWYDLLALGLVLILCSRLGSGVGTISCTALCAATVVSVELLTLHPVDVYGGLSGITAGLLSFAAIRLIVRDARTGIVLLAAMLMKICLEWLGISASGVAPVWQAHCAGAAVGALVSICSLPGSQRGDCRV
ncbi:rhombosortase [Geobacter sp. FeAm09]|uniref:rhombosortase n=1 Tax=Geobacter sp. FeAm09 TaxID=2597769 RepID=UPI0011EFEDAC|nr:rhombosortase [Geobacter sp. FeAm09]QEM67307.1 rhombosortase [Geobacter sp. FeAm09]